MSLRAAFGAVDLTPPPGLPLAGTPYPPLAEGVEWPLYARVGVLDDGERRAAIVALDLLALDSVDVAAIRADAAAAGVDPACVLVSCTHTHRAPFTKPGLNHDRDDGFLASVRTGVARAIVEASGRLEPAELAAGAVSVPGVAFNRRPVYAGEEVGTHGPEWIDGFLRREGPADDELQIVVCRRPGGGEVLGGFVNFGCHANTTSESVYSAEYPGALCHELERRLGGSFGFLQGACGNVAPFAPTAPDARGRDAVEIAGVLAGAAERALGSAAVTAAPRIACGNEVLELEQRRPTPEQVRLARWYLEEAGPDVDEAAFTRALYGHAHTFYGASPEIQRWFAWETIGMWEWQRRSPERIPVDRAEVQVLALGDVAFATFPGELFCEFGLEVKRASPFRTTVVCELANGYVGYIPTAAAFERGGYEPRLAFSSRLVPDAGERLTSASIELLQQLATGAT